MATNHTVMADEASELIPSSPSTSTTGSTSRQRSVQKLTNSIDSDFSYDSNIMPHFYFRTIHDSNAVISCVYANFLSLTSADLIVNKGTRLEVYRIGSIGLELVLNIPVNGRICKMLCFDRKKDKKGDGLVLLTEKKQLLLVGYDEQKGRALLMDWINVHDPSRRPIDGDPLMIIDPATKIIVLHLVQGLVKLIKIVDAEPKMATNSNFRPEAGSSPRSGLRSSHLGKAKEKSSMADARLGVHEASTKTSIHNIDYQNFTQPIDQRVAELQIKSMVFLTNVKAPTFALLSERYSVSSKEVYVKTYQVNHSYQQSFPATARTTEPTTEQLSLCTGPWSIEKTDSEAYELIAVPSGRGGGILIVSIEAVTYYQLVNNSQLTISHKACRMQCYARIDDNGFRFLFGDSNGGIYVLLLFDRANQTRVDDIRIEKLGTASFPSCLAYLDKGHVYVGSCLGDSVVIRLSKSRLPNGSFIETVTRHVNSSPMTDFVLVNMTPNSRSSSNSSVVDKENKTCQSTAVNNRGNMLMVACSNAYEEGSISVISGGGVEIETIGVTEPIDKGFIPLNGWYFNMSKGVLGTGAARYIILSSMNSTRAFTLVPDEEAGFAIEPITDKKSHGDLFNSSCHTIYINQWDQYCWQVTDREIKFGSFDIQAEQSNQHVWLNNAWLAPTGTFIRKAVSHRDQLIFALDNGSIIAIQPDFAKSVDSKCNARKPLLNSLPVESANFLQTWIFRVEPGNKGENVSCIALDQDGWCVIGVWPSPRPSSTIIRSLGQKNCTSALCSGCLKILNIHDYQNAITICPFDPKHTPTMDSVSSAPIRSILLVKMKKMGNVHDGDDLKFMNTPLVLLVGLGDGRILYTVMSQSRSHSSPKSSFGLNHLGALQFSCLQLGLLPVSLSKLEVGNDCPIVMAISERPCILKLDQNDRLAVRRLNFTPANLVNRLLISFQIASPFETNLAKPGSNGTEKSMDIENTNFELEPRSKKHKKLISAEMMNNGDNNGSLSSSEIGSILSEGIDNELSYLHLLFASNNNQLLLAQLKDDLDRAKSFTSPIVRTDKRLFGETLRRICHVPNRHAFLVLSNQIPIDPYLASYGESPANDEKMDIDDSKFIPKWKRQAVRKIVLLDDTSLDVVDQYQLGEDEFPQSVVHDQFANFEIQQEPLVVVGTAIVKDLDQEPEKGRLLTFGVSEDKKLRLLSQTMTDGSVYSLISMEDNDRISITAKKAGTANMGLTKLLVAAINGMTVVYRWTRIGGSNSHNPSQFQWEWKKISGQFGQILGLHLSSLGPYIAVGDIMRSVSLYKYNFSSDDGTTRQEKAVKYLNNNDLAGTFVELARSYRCDWITAVCVLSPWFILAGDSCGNLLLYKRKKDPTFAVERYRMDLVGGIYIGHQISQLKRIPTINETESQEQLIMFSTTSGMIGSLLVIPERIYKQLKRLEIEMSRMPDMPIDNDSFKGDGLKAGHIFGLIPHARFRAPDTSDNSPINPDPIRPYQDRSQFESSSDQQHVADPNYGAIGFVDGNMIELYLCMKKSEKTQLITKLEKFTPSNEQSHNMIDKEASTGLIDDMQIGIREMDLLIEKLKTASSIL